MREGRIQSREPSTSEEFPLCSTNVHRLLVRAYELGNVDTTDHFRLRASERHFTTVDVENVVRTGQLIGKPHFSPAYRNWCVRIVGKIEGRTLEVRLALDPGVDFESPLLTLITGIRRGGARAKQPYRKHDKTRGGSDNS